MDAGKTIQFRTILAHISLACNLLPPWTVVRLSEDLLIEFLSTAVPISQARTRRPLQ